jgi:chromosome segregation ATPase
MEREKHNRNNSVFEKRIDLDTLLKCYDDLIIKIKPELKDDLPLIRNHFKSNKLDLETLEYVYNIAEAKYNKKLEIVNTDFINLKKESDAYKTELTEAKQELVKNKTKLAEAKQESDAYKTELTEARQESDDYKIKLAETKKELVKTKKELVESKQEIDEATQEIFSSKNEVDKITLKLKECERENTSNLKINLELQTKYENIQSEIHKITKDLQSTTKSKNKYLEKCNKLKIYNQELIVLNYKQNEDIYNLKKNNNANKIFTLEHELVQIKKQNNRLNEQNNTLNTQLLEYKNPTKLQIPSTISFAVQTDELNDPIDNPRTEIDKHKPEIDKLHRSLHDLSCFCQKQAEYIKYLTRINELNKITSQNEQNNNEFY